MKGFTYLAACASLFGLGDASTAKPRARDDDGTAACKAFPGTPAVSLQFISYMINEGV